MPPMPATMDAGTAIPGAPVSKPIRKIIKPAPIVHMGQVKLFSSQSCTAGTWRVMTSQPPNRISNIPRTRLVRFCRMGFSFIEQIVQISPISLYEKSKEEFQGTGVGVGGRAGGSVWRHSILAGSAGGPLHTTLVTRISGRSNHSFQTIKS